MNDVVMSDAIKVEGLMKRYDGRAVLKGLNFTVRKGEIFALLGVNGAGKTTALECIENLRKFDGGRIAVNGRMGIQLQSSALPSHIRPMEAIRLVAKWNRSKPDASMLAALGIRELAKKQYFSLSTGQKRRLLLALALISDPDIVVLDEPTAGLDVEARIALHGQIRSLKAQGKTILLASHDMAEVESLSDRIAILNQGAIAFLGTVDELTEKLGRRYLIHIRTDWGEDSCESDDIGAAMLTLLEAYKQKGIKVMDIAISRGTLEQHFIDIARGNSN